MSKQRYTFPIVAAFVVLTLGPLLVAIGARSPYTHAQLLPGPDSGYTRTEQTIVGSPVPYSGEGLAGQPKADEDLVSLGQKLLAARGCAFCHGVTGQGGPVGPVIVGFEVQKLRDKTDQGPDGMPQYAHGALSDDDLMAIVAYLNSVAK